MIGAKAFTGIALMIAVGIILPAAAVFLWLKKHREEKFTTVLIGAATWLAFAMILESIPKAIFLTPLLPIGKKITGNVLLVTVIAALFAGVFEETGRLVAFKTLLRKRKNREAAVSHGLGHGGFEALFLLVLAGVEYIVYAVMINTGAFQKLIDQTAAAGVDVSSLQTLPAQIMAITPGAVCVSAWERIFAMLLHVSLSILVFYAVKKKRPALYILAMLLHALFDVPAALYQVGVIKNIYIVEAMLAAYSAVFFVIIYNALYKKDKDDRANRAETVQIPETVEEKTE